MEGRYTYIFLLKLRKAPLLNNFYILHKLILSMQVMKIKALDIDSLVRHSQEM